MNRLPQHRQALHGRTWGRQWCASDYDPIQVYRSPGDWGSRLLAVAIGLGLCAVIVHWIDWSLA